MSKLTVPSEQELKLAALLRKCILDEVQSKHFDRNQLAQLLELFPSGVGGLMQQTTWSLELAVRVADALGIDVKETLKHAGQ
jgi:hypothetical protein